ncbi:ribosome-associated protein [Sanguibacter gelidistatuariae]|uniref:Ribosome-associated protein n=1 Tax=Sanguibacter gelidistatuariae TaxID=1814289 RepID=A0A1G6KQK3_9MICO|nr:alternative ribosome rescue aminoacyl-tRNA hydrolase ArfB [Sanguibacter gelidistatuariae]SDC33187.1 ribosome-associated protein [Sanguibacter gelidistatuariae]
MDTPLRVTDTLSLAPSELGWRFSRSSGPGGQGVNTADSRVELTWDPTTSLAVAGLPPSVRDRLMTRLEPVLVNGKVVIAASEQRAQLRNRQAARERLAQMLREGIAPPPRARRSTKPTRGSIERRLVAKKSRSRIKSGRSGRHSGADS